MSKQDLHFTHSFLISTLSLSIYSTCQTNPHPLKPFSLTPTQEWTGFWTPSPACNSVLGVHLHPVTLDRILFNLINLIPETTFIRFIMNLISLNIQPNYPSTSLPSPLPFASMVRLRFPSFTHTHRLAGSHIQRLGSHPDALKCQSQMSYVRNPFHLPQSPCPSLSLGRIFPSQCLLLIQLTPAQLHLPNLLHARPSLLP